MQRLDYSIAQRSGSYIQETGKSEIIHFQDVKRRQLTAQWVKIDGQLICQWSRSD
ncbi:MAG: hypothetical protein F6J95_019960 [Leptolyngbya sp. SIO1E4]|nr:hypothetical protein [Leptolyngbya sp. SIO1E4]